MAKVHNNIFVRGLSGAVGDQFVIRRTRSGKTIIANKPHFAEDRVFSAAQKTHQESFREASAYAKLAKTQDLYIQKAMETGSIPYNLAISDWFGRPQVLEIDLKGWTGMLGQSIRVKARDNFRVVRLDVVIRDGEGKMLESGEAVPTAEGSLWWTYTTQAQVTMSSTPTVEATAQDLPGNTSTLTVR
jgi:hypothetical protein